MKKPGLLLPTPIIFLLHASRSRPALDKLRKRVGLHANLLNNSKSICALKYFSCFLSLIVFLVSFLNLMPVAQLVMLCLSITPAGAMFELYKKQPPH